MLDYKKVMEKSRELKALLDETKKE
jgi:hypothetical protein